MKKIYISCYMLMISVVLYAGDAINSDVYMNKKIKFNQNTRVVVLPFEVTADWASDPKESTIKKSVEYKNMEKFELSLLKAGVTVVERQKLDKLLSERNLSVSGFTESDSIQLGKLVSADIIVLGNIPQWSFYSSTKKGFIEILIKGIVVQTGEIAFKAIFDSEIITTAEDFRHDMSQLETKAYKILEEKIKSAIEANSR